MSFAAPFSVCKRAQNGTIRPPRPLESRGNARERKRVRQLFLGHYHWCTPYIPQARPSPNSAAPMTIPASISQRGCGGLPPGPPQAGRAAYPTPSVVVRGYGQPLASNCPRLRAVSTGLLAITISVPPTRARSWQSGPVGIIFLLSLMRSLAARPAPYPSRRLRRP